MLINSLSTDNFLNLSKLKAFGVDKINVTEKLKFLCARIKIIVGKGENAGNQHFLVFPLCFLSLLFQGRLKSGLCGKEINNHVGL